MNEETKKSAYTKANSNIPIVEMLMEELEALLITCDGVGPKMKERVLEELKRRLKHE